MGRKRRLLIAAALAFVVAPPPAEVKSAEPDGRPVSHEYTGILKTKSRAAHLLTLQTQAGVMEFHYRRHGKKDCAGLRELEIGDRVQVISLEKKAVSEATCVTKIEPSARPK